MPVGVDEYLRRSIRHFKAGLAAHKLRFARVRACKNQLKAIVEQAAKYDIELYEIGLTRSDSGLTLEPATTATGGEGVSRAGLGLNLNQSPPDSKNSQSVLPAGTALPKGTVLSTGLVLGSDFETIAGGGMRCVEVGLEGLRKPLPEEGETLEEYHKRMWPEGRPESKVMEGKWELVDVGGGESRLRRLDWPGEAMVRILGACPNPRILKGSLGDGRGVSVWSRGLERVRVGSEVMCVRVRDGEYRRK